MPRHPHRIASLLYAPDPELQAQGKAELASALKLAGSPTRLAENIGVHRRAIYRWAEEAGITITDSRIKGATRAKVEEAVDRLGSQEAAAKELGVSRTTLWRATKKPKAKRRSR
jgi:DNA invertase Pin-like site-specific DNA recombinase